MALVRCFYQHATTRVTLGPGGGIVEVPSVQSEQPQPRPQRQLPAPRVAVPPATALELVVENERLRNENAQLRRELAELKMAAVKGEISTDVDASTVRFQMLEID